MDSPSFRDDSEDDKQLSVQILRNASRRDSDSDVSDSGVNRRTRTMG